MLSFDLYSPFCFILGGVVGLGYWGILGRFLKRHPSAYVTQQIENVHRRFESRAKISWSLIIFGALWMIQVVVEQTLTK